MRIPSVDNYIERTFGKPDFSKSFIDKFGRVLTPIGSYHLWRVDSMKEFINQGHSLKVSHGLEGMKGHE